MVKSTSTASHLSQRGISLLMSRVHSKKRLWALRPQAGETWNLRINDASTFQVRFTTKKAFMEHKEENWLCLS